MKRLYFTLPRKPFAPLKRAKSSNVPQQSCTFDELADLIDPEPDTSTVWKKAVDREKKALLFYQLDLGAEVPRFSKCVHIKVEQFRLKNHSENRLVPSVFLDENVAPTDDGDVKMVLPVAPNISNVMDVVKLLEYVELFPEVPDADDPVVEETALANFGDVEESSFRETPRIASSCEDVSEHSGAVADSMENEEKAVDNSDCGSEYAPSDASESDKEEVPTKKSKKANQLKKPNVSSAMEARVLNDSQVAYSKVVMQSLRKPGLGKVEIYPGAGLYAHSTLLDKLFKRYFQNITKKKKVYGAVASPIPGARLAIDLLDSLGKFTDKLPTDRNSVSEIFDEEFLTIIAKFIGLHHQEIRSGRQLPLPPEKIIREIQNRLRFYHRQNKTIGEETDYMRRKRLNLLTPRKLKRTAMDYTASLILSAADIQWNPRLPYNHPDFRPSYLFPRPDYIPFWPPGDNPPVYIRKQDLEYFCSEQSHTDYPEHSRWIRAVMYKILDEQAMLHICYIFSKRPEKQPGQRLKTSLHSLFSTGFIKMLDEFMRYSGRLTEDKEYLMRTLGYWFKDYRRTVVKRKVLTDDPSHVKVDVGKMVGEKILRKRKR